MGLAKAVAPSFKNLPDRLSRPAVLFSFKSLRSFNTVSSDTKLNLANKSSASVQKNFLKMLPCFL